MHSYKRAIGAAMASGVVVAGLGAGLAASAEAAPPPPPASATTAQRGLLDLIPLQLPLLSGLGGVGSLLSVTQPVWNLLGVTNDIVWLRDGLPIPGTDGLWEYLPTDLDAGHDISAEVTGTLLGLIPLTLVTNALSIPLPGATSPSATTPPMVSGDPKVGKVLTLSAPVWDATGVATTYQWLRAGSPIAGSTATTYTVAPEDIGKAISVRATGTKGAAAPGTATSAPLTALIGDAPTATTVPAITGTPKVGETLTVSAPVWSVATVLTTYQWQRNGAAIPGATATTYAVTAEDVGAALTARATSSKTGYTPGNVTTTPVTGLAGNALTATSPPSIIGTGRIGEQLVANAGAWGTPEPNFAYQWRRDGSPIAGATAPTYTVLAKDATHTLSFQVTATRAGFGSGTATANGVVVRKLASKTQVSPVSKTVGKGTKGVLKIILSATGAKPAGKVAVYDGAKLLKRYSLRAADNGIRIVKLPVLEPGKHRIKAVYAGSGTVLGSTSRPVTLRVLKTK
ncbi:MAG: hypothetical protein JWO11_3777 [Nocardioides sp.]|nr:hypothetical protein [Nocardioides sp.]